MQTRQHTMLIRKRRYQLEDQRPRRILRQFKHRNASVLLRRIVADVRETKVAGQQTEPLGLASGSEG